MNPARPVMRIGRYELYEAFSSGGMAQIHLGRLLGPVGFSKTVAIKRLHPHLANDATFASMLLDEARLAARIRHPNVVSTLDVLTADGEFLIVMEYVSGEPLNRLLPKSNRDESFVARVACIVAGALHGLHAAHEATDERGRPLGLVHRDVSPQNIMVSTEGLSKVLDFGVAKAAGRLQSTHGAVLKGKIAYMAPEQLRAEPLDRRTDVYAAAVVLWEALTGKRLFEGENDVEVFGKVLGSELELPSVHAPGVPPELDAICMRGLERDPRQRFATAKDMARAIEQCCPAIPAVEIGDWVQCVASDTLVARAELVSAIETGEPGLAMNGALESGARLALNLAEHTERDAAPPSSRRVRFGGPGRRTAVVGALGLVVAAIIAIALLRHSESRPALATSAPVALPIISASPAMVAPSPEPSPKQTIQPQPVPMPDPSRRKAPAARSTSQAPQPSTASPTLEKVLDTRQ